MSLRSPYVWNIIQIILASSPTISVAINNPFRVPQEWNNTGSGRGRVLCSYIPTKRPKATQFLGKLDLYEVNIKQHFEDDEIMCLSATSPQNYMKF